MCLHMASTCGEQGQLIWKSSSIVLQSFFVVVVVVYFDSFLLPLELTDWTDWAVSQQALCLFFF